VRASQSRKPQNLLTFCATTKTMNRNKVALIGCGMVGASFAYSFLQRGLANELVLLDKDFARAEGEAMDLNHGLPFLKPMTVRTGSYEDISDAAVIVITAGANQGPGDTRLDLLEKNAAVFEDIIAKLKDINSEAVIIIATNPVDILTQLSFNLLGKTKNRVIGSGTILDTARFRSLLGAHYTVDPRSVHAYIVGEHGDSELALWSTADIGGVPLKDFVGANGQGYDEEKLNAILEQTRNAAYEIIKRKKASYYAIGLGLLSVVEAVLRDQHTVMTVSSPLNGQYGVSGIANSLPSIVGRNGIEGVLEVPMNDDERTKFQSSSQILKDRLAKLG
jgi:L-lactate dehydrogenase